MLLAWLSDLDQPAPALRARLYDADGVATSPVLQVVPPGARLSSLGSLKALDDGTLVFFWTRRLEIAAPPYATTAQLVAERFDPRTMSFEEPVVLAQGPIGAAVPVLNGAGDGVLVWQPVDDLGAPTSGRARVLHLTPQAP